MAAVFLVLLAVSTVAIAQSSASYELSEHTLNSGGASGGSSPASAGFQVSLAAIGELATEPAVAEASSPSFSVSGGFTPAYPAPGEVLGLLFDDATTLSWNTEHSAGTYNLYRDSLGSLAGLGYGMCEQPGLTSATATDSDTPAAGDGYFYLVTVTNRLREEGTKGFDADGAERAGNVCP